MKQTSKLLVLCLFLLAASACASTKEYAQLDKSQKISAAIETQEEWKKWQNELLSSGQIGSPCNYKSLASAGFKKWIAKNPKQIDGLQNKVNSIHEDFNHDGKKDLLLYFYARNCTGHNGGTKTYAKIIYADGTSKFNLMAEIMNAIQLSYNKKRQIKQNLKEISDNYLETKTTISGYNDGIIGKFSLYTKDDAHCCPSYSGNYTFKINEKSIEIEILEN